MDGGYQSEESHIKTIEKQEVSVTLGDIKQAAKASHSSLVRFEPPKLSSSRRLRDNS